MRDPRPTWSSTCAAASVSPPNASSGCSAAASRNARAASGSASPRRTRTCASTCEQPSATASFSACSNAYGVTVSRTTGHVRLGAGQNRPMGAPFPPNFFDRADAAPDRDFYAEARFVQHMDPAAMQAVGDLYDDLGIDGRVLDLFA